MRPDLCAYADDITQYMGITLAHTSLYLWRKAGHLACQRGRKEYRTRRYLRERS